MSIRPGTPFLFRLLMTLLVLGWSLLWLSACGSSRPRPADFSPLRNPDPLLAKGTPTELLSLLERRTSSPRTLQAQGRVTVSEEGQRRRQWFDVNLLYRTPDSVLLRGSRVGPGTLFTVLSKPEESWFFLNREGELYVGTTQELREHLGLLGSIGLSELMGALLVSQEVKSLLGSQEFDDWRTRRSDIRFSDARLGGTRQWTIDRHSGLVRTMELLDDRRQALIRVEYDKYELIEAPQILPTDLRVILPREGVTLRLRLTSYRLDPVDLREDLVFDTRPRGVRSTYPLQQLSWEGPDDAPEPEP
jgi:hypothetical protein